uniref:Cytochrome P450 3A4 n=1 Tax=Aceria tosichella TaxID=561515 RepID=A0A6G1SE89_9ACAR
MYAAIIFILASSVYTIVNVVLVLMRNYKAHQFFQTKAPKLPILPDANIFSGHMYTVTFREKNWLAIDKLHEQYGPTFGYYMAHQPWISTKDLDLLKLIELDKPTRHINRAKFGLPFKEFNESIFQVDDDAWRRVRRAIAPALTNHKVRSEEVSADIEAVLKLLDDGINFRMVEKDGERAMVMDVGDMFLRYTLAVIFSIVYKRDGKINFRVEKDFWAGRMEESARAIRNPFLAVSMMFPFMRPLVEFLVQFHATGKMAAQIINYIVAATDVNRVAREKHARVQRRLSLATGAPERPFSDLKKTDGYQRRLVDTIIDALMEKRVNYDEFIGSLFFLLLAGFQTTADTITCLVWQLARHPHIQEQLRQSIIKDGLDSDYLSWCIQETIRFHPAVPLGTGRILGEDVTVNGMFLPKGSFVMPSTYSIHHDPNIWPEPDEFKPERWRDPSSYHPAAFMGFGLGPRNCVGGKLAMHEIKLVMQLLLTKYRIEKCSGTPDKYAFSAPGMIYTNLDVPVKVRLVVLAGH